MPDPIPEVGYRRVHYTLKTKDGKCQWRTDDGVALSPEFTTQQCALMYQQRMPMIADDEWSERPIADGLTVKLS
jgi:hypothetical protein